MQWQFEVHDDGPSGCCFLLRMSNDKPALRSDGFDTYGDCVAAIHGIKESTGYPRAYVRMRFVDGQFYVAVVDCRNDVIATSALFRSRAARAAAILAIRALAPTAPIVDRRINIHRQPPVDSMPVSPVGLIIDALARFASHLAAHLIHGRLVGPRRARR